MTSHPVLLDHYRALAPKMLLVFLQSKVQSKYQRNDAQDQDNRQEDPPLEPSRAPGRLDALVQLLVCIFGIVLDLHSLLLGPLDDGLLVDDLLVELGEEEGKLAHGLLDALDVVVTGADGAKNTRGLAATVGLELLELLVTCPSVASGCVILSTYSLCEDALVAQIRVCDFIDLGIRRIRVDDAVLAPDGLAIPSGVFCLLFLEVFKLRLERLLQRLNLRPLHLVIGVAHSISL